MTGSARMRDAQGIGSTFATESPSINPDVLPWSGAAQVRYVQSGGQALRLVSDALWADGRRSLLLPSFLCESMLEPFADRPWDLRYFPLTDDLCTTGDSWMPLVNQPELTAVLVAEYFGRTLDAETVARLTALQSAGVRIVEDRTHNLLDWSEPVADFVVGSLRKLLPVGDGGLVIGEVADLGQSESNPGDDYWEAMDLKAAAGAPASQRARELFVRAEVRFAAELDPRSASSRTLEALHHLDFSRMAETRRANGRVLRDLLAGFDIVHRDDDDLVPSHLVMRVDDPTTVQQRLASVGVFCPIHWPKPTRLSARHPWPDDLISLPLDHRYDQLEMAVVAQSFMDIVQS